MIEINNVDGSLAEKIRFLGSGAAFPGEAGPVEIRQTHMSCVFLTRERVYKLKKPVRLSYLDFSTLDRREAACRAELKINQLLAPGVYLAVAPVSRDAQGYSLDRTGEIADWLVVMRRLDETLMLDRFLSEGRLTRFDLNRLVARLVTFYRHAAPALVPPHAWLAKWRRDIAGNHALLRREAFRLPPAKVARIHHTLLRFLQERQALLLHRAEHRHIVDGHGDLRPEHIWLGRPLRIIDRLEFDPALRRLDPFDEAAYLDLECRRLGAAWAGDRIRRGLIRALRNGPSSQLFVFYRCYRAALRARLAAAHLLEPEVRTPEKWRPLALEYLSFAAADAACLERFLRTPAGRRSAGPYATGKAPRPEAARKEG
ncbi:MAG: hypothetical protein KGR48_02305 [Alphaproteobacteria bacterium]|nr:hypothetical protein [Alphaproteobacteria bacterium]MBU6471938.1 hypothetical protein [Alphaproteobacteria bacterium]MDE2011502.1 hypothetical protein [Alphaproteobacteria bacterium]MDE2071893.1 hypothetical protein [Alphaproteobacteria bacterium]MDE2350387.1 hypothetical protein [Alphaproteobacteria bacterium]